MAQLMKLIEFFKRLYFWLRTKKKDVPFEFLMEIKI